MKKAEEALIPKSKISKDREVGETKKHGCVLNPEC